MAFSINDLNYEKDSKERMPWEHYTEEFGKADPAEIAGRLSIPYDEEKKELTLKFLGTVYHISWWDFILLKRCTMQRSLPSVFC